MVAIITDVHYRMSLALIRCLGQAGVRVYTVEWEDGGEPLGKRSRYSYAHLTLPKSGDALLEAVIRIGKREGCKPALLPIGAATLQLLSARRAEFADHAGLCIAAPDQLELLNSKQALATLADRLSIPTPRAASKPDFLPCVIKPLCGEKLGLAAAERYVIAHTAEQAEEAYARFHQLAGEPPILQEYLCGGGGGCSVIAQEGRILAFIGHQRLREYPVSGGPSSCCRAVSPMILDWAEKLVAETNFSGPAMFEYKEDAQGMPRLLECNPRIWGSFPLARTAKSSLPMAWFAAAWNAGNPDRSIPIPANVFIEGRKMRFFPTDALAGLQYLKKGQIKKGLAALFDCTARDGLFEWQDAAPAFAYYRSLFKRGGAK